MSPEGAEEMAKEPLAGNVRAAVSAADADDRSGGTAPPGEWAFLSPPTGPGEIGWLGHYRVRSVLGAGGMGIVLRAEHTQLQRPVALKVIKPELGQKLEVRQRFLREARAMAQVRSDHVVTVYDVGQVNDVCFLAMELLEGEPLDLWLALVAMPPVSEVLRIGREIAEALAAAHTRGLIHRDIKPANVFLEAPARRVKLLDFGLARAQVVDEKLTATGLIVGTPAYMAPEQARGVPIDARADLFSLGCVLYEMASGRPPFEGHSVMALLTALAVDTPLAPSHHNSKIPTPVSDLVMRLLAKNPADRPPSAQVLIAQLLGLERGEPAFGTAPESQPQASLPANLTTFRASAGASIDPLAATLLPGKLEHTIEAPSSSPRARNAERRQVTVLICGSEIFESEAYLANLEAEDQAKVLRAFQRECGEAVRRHDGTIVQCNEEGLAACFGFPVAYEDAAARATRTGLEILEAMKGLGDQFRGEYRLELNPWIALHTGLAVVEARADGISLVGEARTVAARLHDACEPGQVVCSAATHLLIQNQFQCASLGSHKLKGVAQPIELFQVQAAAAVRNRIEAAEESGLTPLTGRDQEINLLRDRWEQAQEGMGQVVLLIGEAGLGKSRLVYTLKQHVSPKEERVSDSLSPVSVSLASSIIEWRCSPQFQNTSLYPVRDFFERLLWVGRQEGSASRFDQLVRYLSQYDLARADAVPLFSSLLSLSPDQRFSPLALSPVREREETFRVLREWIGAIARRQPVLFIVEDLHWVDASTLEFLGQFLAEGLHDRVLTVLTFRPEFQTPWPTLAHQTSLALNRLSRRQVGDLMRKLTGIAVPDAVVERVFERTGGVPFFVEEFTKMVQESGLLSESGDHDSSRTQTLLAHKIPATLQDLVMARLDRMTGDREVVQLAATLGREFSHELLAAATTLDDAALQAELTKLVQAEILYLKGRPPQCSYAFKHALLQDAAYNAMVKDVRRQCHQRVVDAMEARFPRIVETQPELLAHHCTEAGLTAKAIGYWLAAGLRSRERSAEVEAICHLTRGQALLETLDESPERDARELELLTPLGTAYIASRGYAAPEVGPVFSRARQLCERVGQPTQLFAIILGNWEWHTVRGNLRHCIDLAAEGIEFARRVNDPGFVMEALFMLAETMLYRGDFAGARHHFATAVADYDDRERTKYWAAHTSHNAGITCRSNLAVCLWHLGFPDQALTANREMLRLARDIGHPYSLAYALHHSAWLHQYCRIGAEVQAAADEEMTIADAQAFALWRATATFFRGAGLLLLGKWEQAAPLCRTAIEAFRNSGSELTLTSQLSLLGEAYLQGGRFAEARQTLDDGLALTEKNDERCQEAELFRLKGELLLSEPRDQEAAEICFRRAIENARRQQSLAWELRSTMSLARLRERQGRRAEAREALAAVYGRYTEGFTTPDLVDAKLLLDTLV